MIHLTAQLVTVDAAAPDAAPDAPPARTITGLAVPWNVTASVSDGTKVCFLPGSLSEAGPAPKLLGNHDMGQLMGMVTERVSTDEGMMFTAKLANIPMADNALELMTMGALDSVSVGAVPVDFKWAGDTMMISAANWVELSIVPIPAFASAQIATVAAEAAAEPETDSPPSPEEIEMPEIVAPVEAATVLTTPIYAEAATVLTTPIYATAAVNLPLPTPAEYIAAMAAGGERFARVQAAVRAAAPDVLTSDTPGILPQIIVSPVYNNFLGLRPVIDACGARAMPAGGKIFIRPSVTTHTSMAVQSAENTSLQAGTFVVTSNAVTKGTYGGYATISEQDIDWTDPNVVALILDDMARIYANTTDNVAADALVTAATVTETFDPLLIADPAEWTRFAYAAGAAILTGSNGNLPTHMFVDTGTWAALGQLCDTAGRPLFPQMGPMNAFGSLAPGNGSGVAFGLNIVVDRNFAADTLIIGDTTGFECFEQQKGALSLTAPDTISRTISWHGYFSTLMIDNTKFIKADFS